MSAYAEFLESKLVSDPATGLSDVPTLPAGLFPFQHDLTSWALRRGRAAIFADTGLGKTAMQLAWADAVAKHTGKPVLIFAPLAVAQQTVREGEKFGIKDFARHQAHREPVRARRGRGEVMDDALRRRR